MDRDKISRTRTDAGESWLEDAIDETDDVGGTVIPDDDVDEDGAGRSSPESEGLDDQDLEELSVLLGRDV